MNRTARTRTRTRTRTARTTRHLLAAVAAAVAAALATADRAAAAGPAAVTWDGGGGAGTNWYNANNWVGDVQPVSGTTTAVTFAGTTSLAPLQDIANPFVLNTLTFSPGAGAFVLGGNGLALGDGSANGTATLVQSASSPIAVNNALTLNNSLTLAGIGTGTLTLGGAIGGAGGLTLPGPYATVLSGSNTYRGGTSVAGGTLAVTSTGSIGTSGGTLSVNGPAGTAVTLAGNADGTGGRVVSDGTEYYGSNPADQPAQFYGTFIQTGGTHTAAAITFGFGHNTHGAYNLQAGVLSVPGTVQIGYGAAGSTSEFHQTGGTFTAGLVAVGSLGSYELSGGTLSAARLTVYGDALNLNGGTLRATADDPSATTPFLTVGTLSTVNVQAGGAQVDTNGHAITFGGPLLHGTAAAVDGGLTKTGAGTLSLNGDNTYTGPTAVTAGTLVLASGSQAISTLTLGTATSGGAYTLAGGTLTLGTTGRGAGGAPFTFNGGTLRPTAASATPLAGATAVYVAAGGATIDTNGNGMSIAQPLAAAGGTGALTKAGAGTLTLSGSSTYAGGTSVAGGTLAVASTGSIGTAGGTLYVNGPAGTAVTLAGNADGTGGRVVSDGTEYYGSNPADQPGPFYGTFTQAGGTHTAAAMTFGYGHFTHGTYNLQAGVLNVTGTAQVNLGAAGSSSEFNQTGGTFTAAKVAIATDGTYDQAGGTLSAGRLSVYGGALNLNGGTLVATADDPSATTPFLDVGGGGSAVNVLAGGAKVDTNGHAITFGGPLLHGTAAAADGGLTKAGAGTLTLNTANTYAGPTTVNGGTLVLAHPYDGTYGTLNASSAVTVNNGGTLQLGNASNGNNVITATGTTIVPLTVTAGGTVTTFAGTTHNLGAVTLTGGTLAGSPSPLAGFGDYTLNGPGAVTVNGATDSAISAPGGVGMRGTINVIVAAGGGRLLVPAPLRNESGAVGGLAKLGGGTMVLSAAESYTGPTNVSGGTLQLTPTASLASTSTSVGTGTLELTAAAAGSGTAVRTIAGLAIRAGGLAKVDAPPAPAARQLLVASGLTFGGTTGNWQGTLDLTGNDLDVPNGSLATLTSQAAQGFAGGTWNGSGGLVSATAAADARHLTAVGVISNATAGYASFDGRAVSAADVLARFTYYGDANLDGVVNAADYTRTDVGYAGHLTGWANGDFNYDGVVDGSDYALMDNAFNRQAGTIGAPASEVAVPAVRAAAGGVAAVPEPASVGLVVAGVLLLGRPRGRRGLSVAVA